MSEPHFYRLRKKTAGKVGDRKCDGDMRKGLLKPSPLRQQ
jgi:hypothetical protein